VPDGQPPQSRVAFLSPATWTSIFTSDQLGIPPQTDKNLSNVRKRYDNKFRCHAQQ